MANRNEGLAQKLLLFLIWPFGAFLHSFSNPSYRSSRIVIYFWFIVFGMSFVPLPENGPLYGDATSYKVDFEQSQNITFAEYKADLDDYFNNSMETDVRDIYTLTLYFIVGNLTGNYHVLFMVFAMVFGFFYVKSMSYVLPRQTEKHDLLILPILFLLFCFSNPIYNINGVRFWTASWVAVYMMLKLLIDKDYKYLLFIPIIYMIHAGFIVFIFVILFYFLFKRFHKAWNIVFIFSLFFSAASFVSVLDENMGLLPASLQRFIMYYADEDIIASKQQGIESLPLYAQIFRDLPKILINILVAICLLNRREIEKRCEASRVLDFLVVFMSVINFTMSIPSVGGRFLSVSIPFLIYILTMNPSLTKKYNIFIYMIPVAYSYRILYWFRDMVDISDVYTYIMPFPYLIIHNLF